VSVVDPPYATLLGFAVSVQLGTFGCCVTVTETWHVTVWPFEPVTVSVNVLFVVMFVTVYEPFTPTLPMPLSSEAETAFDDVQNSVVDPPLCTCVGFAFSVQLGGFCTCTVTFVWHVIVCPFVPTTVRVYV
jgi:hypothetical protein